VDLQPYSVKLIEVTQVHLPNQDWVQEGQLPQQESGQQGTWHPDNHKHEVKKEVSKLVKHQGAHLVHDERLQHVSANDGSPTAAMAASQLWAAADTTPPKAPQEHQQRCTVVDTPSGKLSHQEIPQPEKNGAPTLEVVAAADLPPQFAVEAHEDGHACESTMFLESDSTTDITHGILSMQKIEIEEVVDAIYDNISQQRTDLGICRPELKNVLVSLLQDHCCEIEHVAEELVQDHHMSRMWKQMGDKLVASAREALYR
jgi:hypothetical protein